MEHVACTHVGGVRRTFGNGALRIESKLPWAARSGRPFREGLPCLWGEATTKLKAGSTPPRRPGLGRFAARLDNPGRETRCDFQAIPWNSKKSRSEKSQDSGSLGLGAGGSLFPSSFDILPVGRSLLCLCWL